jgi:hypothetical protein
MNLTACVSVLGLSVLSVGAAQRPAAPVPVMAPAGGGSSVGTTYCGPAPVNVTGFPGVISATGSATVANNDLTLRATQLPTNTLAWFIASETQGFVANPGGCVGNLCLSGVISRFNWFPMDTGPFGEISLQVDLTNIPSPAGWTMITAGTTWNFQALYRDAVAGVGATNLSDALSIQFR